GSPAPNSQLPALTSDGTGTLSLSELKGKWIVLYFYPKDNTPGCTQEASDFRDVRDEFDKRETVILGVSRDSLASHEKFRNKKELNFPLLADTEEIACQRYDVLKEKNMYGKMRIGIERSTFLIDKSGNIAHVWRKVKVQGHVQEVLEKIDALQ